MIYTTQWFGVRCECHFDPLAHRIETTNSIFQLVLTLADSFLLYISIFFLLSLCTVLSSCFYFSLILSLSLAIIIYGSQTPIHKYSATGYAIEPRQKQIQDEDAGHIFREATSASSISDSVNRINKNQYNYRDEVNFEYFFFFLSLFISFFSRNFHYSLNA